MNKYLGPASKEFGSVYPGGAITHRNKGRSNVTHGFDARESSPPATHKYGDDQHTSGAMERYSGFKFAGKLTTCQTTHIAIVSISAGRWNVTRGFDMAQNSRWPATTHRKTVSVPVGRWNVTCMGSIWQLSSLRSATAHRIRVSITSGAMEDMSGKVQNANTHSLRGPKS